MAKGSNKANKSIYQQIREELGLTRADAVKIEYDDPDYVGMDGITESRLVKIEHGDVNVQPEDVVAMAKRYNKPELRNYYCCNECAIGKMDTPEVIYNNDIHEILVNMAISLRKVNHDKIRLMEILEDSIVEQDEIEDYDRIISELNHISQTIESLKMWCEKKKVKK